MGDELTMPDVGLHSRWLAQNDAPAARLDGVATDATRRPASRAPAAAAQTQSTFQVYRRIPPAIQYGLLAGAALTVPTAFFTDRLAGNIDTLPGTHETTGGATFLLRTIFDATATASYTFSQPAASNTVAAVADGVYGAGSLLGCGLWLGSSEENYQVAGRNLCISGLSNIASARAYRHFGPYGAIFEGALGLSLLIASAATPGRTPPPDFPRGPGEAELPSQLSESLSRDLASFGWIHIGNAGLHVGAYFLIQALTRSGPSAVSHRIPNVGFSPTQNGGTVTVQGTF